MGCAMSRTENSKNLNALSESILLMLLGIEMKFVETNKLGMALKLLRIRKLTKKHFRTNGYLRERLSDRAHFCKSDIFERFDTLMTKEVDSLKNSHTLICKIYKKVFNCWTMPKEAEIEEYATLAQKKHKDTVSYLKKQLKSYSSDREFNSVVYNVGFRTLTKSEEELIKSICMCTTYTFTNKNRRITYSSIAKYIKVK